MIDDKKVQASLEFDNFELTFFAQKVGWFEGESQRNFVHVYAELGKAHLTGYLGYKESVKLAMRYFERGALLGSGDCAMQMARIYVNDTWWWGRPKKDERTIEFNKWRKKATELWEWEAINLQETYAAYSLFHQFKPLNSNTPDPFRDHEKAEKWRAKTIELSKAAGDEYQNFV